MTVFTGSVPTVNGGDTTTVPTNFATWRDIMKATSEPWTSFGSFANFGASGVNPSGGTWTAKYMQVNKLVMFWMRIVQSASVGSGNYKVTLPTTPATNYPAHFDIFITDVSTSAVYRGVTFGITGPTVSLAYDANGAANAPLQAISNSTPFTMAVGDIIEIAGTYESA